MTKKKKMSIAVLLIVLCVVGFWVNRQYQTYTQKKQEEYVQMYVVYEAIHTEENPDTNPVKSIKDVEKVKKNPPAIEMNGSTGLYIKAMVYEYLTGNTVDYLEIQEWMNTGQIIKVSNKYDDFISWINDKNISERKTVTYVNVVAAVAASNGYNVVSSSTKYEDYKKIIEAYPDEIDVRMKKNENKSSVANFTKGKVTGNINKKEI